MSRRVLAVSLAAALAAGGWALAQQEPLKESRDDRAASSRYAVVRVDKGALLVDTVTGKTWAWVVSSPGQRPGVWAPIRRLESDKEFQRWLDREQQQGRATADRERQRALEVEALRRALEDARREAEAQRDQAQRAFQETRRRLDELLRKKATEAPK
jgi:hypothetical protein